MTNKPLPDAKYLRYRMSYNPDTGMLIWNPKHIKTAHDKMWNKRFAGTNALNNKDRSGYLYGHIDGVRHKAHRIIWKMVYGEDPAEIDHINRVRSDNRIVNLRVVNRFKNMQNLGIRCDNQSGTPGVYFHKQNGKWVARIGINGHKYSLGSYSDIGDAIRARHKAEVQYGFVASIKRAMEAQANAA